MDFLEAEIRFLVLHWVRCIALFAPLPIFGNSGASRAMRVAIGLALGTSLALVSSRAGVVDPGGGAVLAAAVLKEAFFGYLLGWIVSVGFAAIRVAGDLVGTEMGFNMSSITDPVTGVNTQVMAHLFESIGFMVFFAVDGHLAMLRALAFSFERWPVTTFALDGELVRAIVGFTTGVMATGLRIAAPVVVALILLGVGLAILAKVAPQLQIMMFGFPVKILGGCLVLIATFGAIIPGMAGALEEAEQFLFAVANGL